MSKTTRLLKSLRPQNHKVVPIASDMILPNKSGDHQGSIKRQAPVGIHDLTNKEYVDLKADGNDPDHTHSKLVSPSGTFPTVVNVTDSSTVGFGIASPDSGTLNTDIPLRMTNSTPIQWDRNDGSPVSIFNVTPGDDLLFKIPRNGSYFVVQDPGSVTMFQVIDVGLTSRVYLNGTCGLNTESPDTTFQNVGSFKTGDDNTNYVEIESDGDVNFVGGGGMQFGEIYVHDNSTADTVSTATWTQMTRFDTDGVSNGSVTPSNSDDHITVGKAGMYLITISLAFSGTASVDWEFSAFKNNGNTELENVHTDRKLGAGGDIGSASLSGIIDCAANDTIELWMRHAAGVDKDITVETCTMSLVQIGGT